MSDNQAEKFTSSADIVTNVVVEEKKDKKTKRSINIADCYTKQEFSSTPFWGNAKKVFGRGLLSGPAGCYFLLSLLGFVMCCVPLYFVGTPAYLMAANWRDLSFLNIFPWGWIFAFGERQAYHPVAAFHYALAWFYIPAFWLVLLQERERRVLSFSFLVHGVAGSFLGCCFTVPLLLATSTERVCPIEIRPAGDGGTTRSNLVSFCYLILNLLTLFAFLHCFHNPTGHLFTTLALLQILLLPICYCALQPSVAPSPKLIAFWGLVGAVWCVMSAINAVSALRSVGAVSWDTYTDIVFGHAFTFCMWSDGVLLAFTALAFILFDPPSSGREVQFSERLICAGLTLVLPLGPAGLCLFATLNNHNAGGAKQRTQ